MTLQSSKGLESRITFSAQEKVFCCATSREFGQIVRATRSSITLSVYETAFFAVFSLMDFNPVLTHYLQQIWLRTDSTEMEMFSAACVLLTRGSLS